MILMSMLGKSIKAQRKYSREEYHGKKRKI